MRASQNFWCKNPRQTSENGGLAHYRLWLAFGTGFNRPDRVNRFTGDAQMRCCCVGGSEFVGVMVGLGLTLVVNDGEALIGTVAASGVELVAATCPSWPKFGADGAGGN